MRSLLALPVCLLALPLCAQSPAKPGALTCSAVVHTHTDADRAFAADNYAQAESLYTQQLAASPTEATFQGLVRSQIEQDKVTDALATAHRAVEALPKSANALALLGDAELRAGDIEAASKAYIDARSMDPCSAAAHFGNARILELGSMRASAQKELAFAHRLDLSNADYSEAVFATVPPPMHAKGLRNLLASDHDLSPAHRSRLEQQAALLEAGATCHPSEMTGPVKLDLTPVFVTGTTLRDYGVRIASGGSNLTLDLDSTASGIVLTESDARKLGVKPAVAGTPQAPYLGYLDSVQAGPLHFDKCPVSVVADSVLARRYSLIGTDFFRDSLIHLDFHAKQLTLTPFPGKPQIYAESNPVDASTPDAEKTWAHTYIDQQRLLVPSLLDKKYIGLVMLDTSYIPDVLSPAAAAAYKPIQNDVLSITGVSGDYVRIFRKDGGGDFHHSDIVDPSGKPMVVRIAVQQKAFNLANVHLREGGMLTFDITPISHSAGLDISGIVGFPWLHEYFIDLDYRNGLVHLDYDTIYNLRNAQLFEQGVFD